MTLVRLVRPRAGRWIGCAFLAGCVASASLGQAPVHPAAPGLSLSELRLAAASVAPGEKITVEAVVQSNGVCPDCASIQLAYWDDSRDGAVNCADGANVIALSNLAEASETTIHVVLQGYPRPGQYRAWFWLNCEQAGSEQDQPDNKRFLDILVTPAGAAGPTSPDNAPDGPPVEEVASDLPPAPPDSPAGPDPAAPPVSPDPAPPLGCGWFAGPSAWSAVACPALSLLGLACFKYRHRCPGRQR